MRVVITFLIISIAAMADPSQRPDNGPFGELTVLEVASEVEVNKFIQEVSDIVQGSRTEPGNIAWYVQQSDSDKKKFIFYTRWKNGLAFDEHFKLIQAYLDKTKPYTTADVTFYKPVDVLPGEDNRELLLGGWKLVSFTIDPKGEKIQFCGKEGKSTGILQYERTGFMSAAINCQPMDPDAPAKDYQGMLFYSGKFDVKGNSVLHHISNSSSPTLIGQTFTRTIQKIDNQSLVLGGTFGKDGKEFEIYWTK